MSCNQSAGRCNHLAVCNAERIAHRPPTPRCRKSSRIRRKTAPIRCKYSPGHRELPATRREPVSRRPQTSVERRKLRARGRSLLVRRCKLLRFATRESVPRGRMRGRNAPQSDPGGRGTVPACAPEDPAPENADGGARELRGTTRETKDKPAEAQAAGSVRFSCQRARQSLHPRLATCLNRGDADYPSAAVDGQSLPMNLSPRW